MRDAVTSMAGVHAATAARSRPPVYFLATYWGARFQDWLCRFAVASLLAPGNVPALRERARCKFLICTTEEDWRALQEDPHFRRLRALIDVVFLRNEERGPNEHKYVRMSRGHAMLAQACFEDGALAFNVNPDSIYPDGCVAEVERLYDNGHRVVLCAAIRFDLEGVEAELIEQGHLAADRPVVLSMREAARLGLRHFHIESKASEWEAPNFGALSEEHRRDHYLTCCFWRVPGTDGGIIVTHNWAPLLVDYTILNHHDTSTLDGRAIDGVYIFENFREARIGSDIHVVRDSDSIFLLGMTPRDEMVPPQQGYWWKSNRIVGPWCKGYILNQTIFDPAVDETRRHLYGATVAWHSAGRDASWLPVERKADRILQRFATRDLKIERIAGRPGAARSVAGLLADPVGFVVTLVRALLAPLGIVPRLAPRLLGWRGTWWALEAIRRAPLYVRVVVLALRGDREATRQIGKRARTILRAMGLGA